MRGFRCPHEEKGSLFQNSAGHTFVTTAQLDGETESICARMLRARPFLRVAASNSRPRTSNSTRSRSVSSPSRFFCSKSLIRRWLGSGMTSSASARSSSRSSSRIATRHRVDDGTCSGRTMTPSLVNASKNLVIFAIPHFGRLLSAPSLRHPRSPESGNQATLRRYVSETSSQGSGGRGQGAGVSSQ